MPFGQIVRVEIFSGIIISPLDLLVFILSFYLIFHFFSNIKLYRFEKFHYFLITFWIFGLISLIFKIPHMETNEFLSSLGYSVRFLMYVIPLFFLHQFYKHKGEEILNDVVLSGFLFVLFGIAQYLYLPRLELLIFLGEWDIHSFRLFSTFFDPNYAGLYITIEILLLYGLLWTKRNNVLYWIILVLSYIALFLTYSRSSIVALIFGTLVYLVLLKKYMFIFASLLLFCASIFALHLFSKQFGGEGVRIFRTASIQTRLESYSEGMRVFSHNPFIGSGFNTYKYARKNFEDLNNYDALSNASNAPSNSYIFILATTGIFGCLAFLAFSLFLLKKLAEMLRFKNERPIVAGGIAALMSLYVHSLFQNSFFYSPIVIMYVLVAVGVISYNYSRE